MQQMVQNNVIKTNFKYHNLKQHKENFGVDAKWRFFLNSPCKKVKTRQGSLQVQQKDAILTSEALFNGTK